MSRYSLGEIILPQRGLNLYENERREWPLEIIENEMRKNIRVTVHPGMDFLLVDFRYPDRRKAHDTVQALIARFTDAGLPVNEAAQPSVPMRPIFPNRPLMAAMGSGTGFLMAIAMSVFRRRSPDNLTATFR